MSAQNLFLLEVPLNKYVKKLHNFDLIIKGVRLYRSYAPSIAFTKTIEGASDRFKNS